MLRSYVWKWIFLLILIPLTLVIGMRAQAVFFIFLFWFLSFAVVSGLAWLAVSYLLAGLSVRCEHLPKAFEDERINFGLELRNDGPMPLCNLYVSYELPFALPGETSRNFLIDCLSPFSARTINFSPLCYRRGRYVIGHCAVYFFDPFNIFFLKKRLPVYSELYVYPRVFPIQSFPPLIKGSLPWFGIDSVKSGGDDDEFYGTREYRFGDPIKTIHWVSTARKNKLIVKQFQRQSYYRATLLFNLEKESNFGEGRETACEYIIKIAGSIAKYMVEKNVSVEMIAHTGEIVHIEPNKGHEHLEEIMKFLTVAMPESGVGLGEIVQEFSAFIPSDSNLIVIMLDSEWESFLSSVMADTRGLSFIPVILVGSSFLGQYDAKSYASDLKVKLYKRFNFNPIVISCGDSLEDAFAES